jgi:metal-sulfur cluster biosynthetic enzyme
MNKISSSPLQEAVMARLQEVIDPETNADVLRMRLVENLTVDRAGKVCYTFRPSSPLCPIALFLVSQIKQAVAEVPGVTDQEIRIEGYIAAEEMTILINQEVS